ncbi:MAG TPA: helix-turn-helix domain-containing protein, partial [Candidatus Angelobacter sp.]|nr:helix-turn-helix domain-containing protein [Candidatus Angelobacter sp.]
AIFHAVMYAKNPETEISAADLRLPEAAPTTNGHALNGDLNQVERQMIFQALEKFDGNQGKAAESLGISRRTLIRKLKAYRENDSENQEQALRAEQERYYRAQMSVPVRFRYGAEQMEATLLNLSIGGAAILIERSLSFGMPASIFFVIPDTDQEVELSGKVAWSNSEGQHGIQFSDLSPEVRSSLLRWLTSQMKREEVIS